jgi:hypothetical protein
MDVAYTCIFSVLDVSYVYCKCFIWILHRLAMIFKCLSDIFGSVSDACSKCFIYLLLYVTTVASTCFKSRSGVAHGMRMEAAGSVGDFWGWHGPTAVHTGVLAHSLCGYRLMLAPCVGRPGTCKSDFKSIDIFYIYTVYKTLSNI